MEVLLSNEFTDFQLYPEIDDADWEVLNFSAKIAAGRFFFDLPLASRSTGKVIPVLMNELVIQGDRLSEVRLSATLGKLPDGKIMMLATEALRLAEPADR